MEKVYEIAHDRKAIVPFPITEKQLEHEIANFEIAVHNYKRNDKVSAVVTIDNEVITLILNGNVSEAELDAEAEQLLLKINKGALNSIGKPCFVVNKSWISKP